MFLELRVAFRGRFDEPPPGLPLLRFQGGEATVTFGAPQEE